ncbi:MAG: hypothetical protein LBI62_02635 [Candidatus Accumulibacter sp.]|jgi:hypothetical protein|nr:hypothetical protein [Accumulibacter sp.]
MVAVLGEKGTEFITAFRPPNQGSGIRDQGSGIRDQGSGIRDQGSGIRDQGSEKVTGGFAAAEMFEVHGFTSFSGAKRRMNF